MRNYRLYQEYPYYDMHNNYFNYGHSNCGCNNPPPNIHQPCYPCNQFPPFPPNFPNSRRCSNSNLLYLLSGIIIGRSLDDC